MASEIKINGVSLSQIDDVALLSKLVSSTQDFETRKTIRERLQQVKSEARAAPTSARTTTTTTTMTTAIKQSAAAATAPVASKPAASATKRIESDGREELIQQRQRDAAASKARTLQMYDNMAKSGNAGDHRQLDIDTYRGKPGSGKMISGTPLQKTDLVEETIRERVKRSEENKKRLLAAFDYAAKTQPSGTVRDVDFGSFVGVDVSGFEADNSAAGAATFGAQNGVPRVVKVNSSVPSTPVIDIKKAPSFTQEQPQLDSYERALRQRKQEADERKKRTLAAYDAIARSGDAGPKIVVREELEQMDIPEPALPPKPKFSCTSSFAGGYART